MSRESRSPLAATAVCAAILVLLGACAPSLAPSSSSTSAASRRALGPSDGAAPAPSPSALAQRLDWGVFADTGDPPIGGVLSVVETLGARPTYVNYFAAIDQQVPFVELDAIKKLGATPIVTLEPWMPGAGVDQPTFALRAIASGEHDGALTRWARGLATWNNPVLLRFAHEMNTPIYPWGVGVNGNSASDYIAAWRHLRAVFEREHASLVRFVWAPNIPFPGSTPMRDAYPGRGQVDVLGLDGYNWGDGQGLAWTEPDRLFGPGLDELRAVDPTAPILITEVASAEDARKPRWIGSLFSFLARSPRVVGLVWFDSDKERDWRIDSSRASAEAFAAALAARPTR